MEGFPGHVPMELVTEVLVRLPVKSLARFRCVCKSWNSLISSHDFASLHLSRYHNNHDNTHLFTATFTDGGKYQWMLLSSHTYKKITRDDYAILDNRDIMDHFDDCYPRGSSVNGLLLLSKLHGMQTEPMLWNPVIGKTHKLPTDCIDSYTRFGFGFSCLRNDYKVVAINPLRQKTSVHIYSLSTRTWRRIVEYNESIICTVHYDGVLVEGTMHFLPVSSLRDVNHMVMFDVNAEVFSYIELPCKGRDSYVVAYHEMVGLFYVQETCCDLWVMEKDWVPGSWRKLYTIDFGAGISRRMLLFKENGEFMWPYKNGEVTLHHVESKRVEQIRESCSDRKSVV